MKAKTIHCEECVEEIPGDEVYWEDDRLYCGRCGSEIDISKEAGDLSLAAPVPTRYRAIRAARRPDQVSTLEATVQALAMLEGPGFDAAPLLDAFGCFVAGVAARQRPLASSN